MSEFGDIRSKLEDYEKITKGLRGIYSEAPVAIATANSEGMFIEGNKTTLNLYGLKDISELQLQNIFNDPSLSEKDKKELRNGKSIQYSATFDFDKLRREGIMKTSRSGIGHYQIFISPFFLREIGQSGYLSIIVDVTERKNIEDKLRESEEIYRKLVETSPDAITVTDLNGHIVTISQQTLKIHGFKNEEEVLGKSAMILIASESHQKAIDNMARTFEEGSIRNEEYNFIRKDGTKFPAELNASVISDVNENPTHLIAVTRDITKQKEVEQTLRENEEKLRLLFDNANDSIFLVKLDKKGRIGKFVEVNEATIKWTGYSKEELLEMTPTQLMSEEVIADVKNVI
ncbi:MAG: PAS domain S-box protein, partial [Candidatus Heimdallarchaeota archaeon]